MTFESGCSLLEFNRSRVGWSRRRFRAGARKPESIARVNGLDCWLDRMACQRALECGRSRRKFAAVTICCFHAFSPWRFTGPRSLIMDGGYGGRNFSISQTTFIGLLTGDDRRVVTNVAALVKNSTTPLRRRVVFEQRQNRGSFANGAPASRFVRWAPVNSQPGRPRRAAVFSASAT